MEPRSLIVRTARPALAATLLFAATLLLASSSGAQSANNGIKVVVVDLELVFFRSPAGQHLQKQLNELQEATKTQIEQRLREIEEIEQAARTATPAEQLELVRRREDAQIAVRRIQADAQRRASKMEEESRKVFNDAVQPALDTLQSENGYDLILNKAPGVVIFAGQTLDITGLVIEKIETG